MIMAHGHPDWGAGQTAEVVHRVTDLGEMAVRLGAVNRFDRAGSVIEQISYQSGRVRFWGLGGGLGGGIALSAGQARSGGYSCEVTAPMDETLYAFLSDEFGVRHGGRIGFEISLLVHEGFTKCEGRLRVRTRDAIRHWQWRFDAVTGIWYVQTGAVTFVSVSTTADLMDYQDQWHTIKMVVDPDTGKYHRLLVDANDIDVTAYSGYAPGVGGNPYIRAWFYFWGSDTDNEYCYVDDVIITENEP